MKKRSVANSASPKPPEQLTFFLDRQLGRYKMAGRLREARLNVEIHDDHFAPDAKDEEWLTVVGRKEWIVITRDERQPRLGTWISACQLFRVSAFENGLEIFDYFGGGDVGIRENSALNPAFVVLQETSATVKSERSDPKFFPFP